MRQGIKGSFIGDDNHHLGLEIQKDRFTETEAIQLVAGKLMQLVVSRIRCENFHPILCYIPMQSKYIQLSGAAIPIDSDFDRQRRPIIFFNQVLQQPVEFGITNRFFDHQLSLISDCTDIYIIRKNHKGSAVKLKYGRNKENCVCGNGERG